MRAFIKQILSVVFPPPLPEGSDVVEVAITREINGQRVKFTLSGEAASRWGYFVTHNRLYRMPELYKLWKQEVLP